MRLILFIYTYDFLFALDIRINMRLIFEKRQFFDNDLLFGHFGGYLIFFQLELKLLRDNLISEQLSLQLNFRVKFFNLIFHLLDLIFFPNFHLHLRLYFSIFWLLSILRFYFELNPPDILSHFLPFLNLFFLNPFPIFSLILIHVITTFNKKLYYYNLINKAQMEPESKAQSQQLYKVLLQKCKQQQAVGIQNFITQGKPIPAVTKYMLTDFIVNQISEQGKLIALKDKPDINSFAKTNQKGKYQQKPKPQPYEISKQVLDELIGYVGEQASKSICELYSKLDRGEKVAQWQFTIEDFPNKDKQERTKFHTFIRQKLRSIQSNFLEGSKMKLKLNKNIKKISMNSRNKYIHFVLFKSNIDTMGALFKLSKITGINQKLFSSAGLKDKRGVTTQMISLFNSDVNQLKKFYNAASRNREIWIEDFVQNQQDAIGVGSLYGNQFGLILRLVNPQDAQFIHQRVNGLKSQGMINYFGMQRFGNSLTKTHMIGLKLVKKKWKQVIQDLLLEDTRDFQVNQLKKQCYQDQQYAKAERNLSNKYKIQKNLFKGLKKYGKNYQNVFQSLPRSIRTLYTHSLQSYLWNRMVSRRIKQYGIKIVKGDLIGKKIAGVIQLKPQIQQEKLEKEQNQKQNEEVQVQNLQQQVEEKYEVELITDENIQAHKITDVVFPLYGPMINLPKQSLAYHYLESQFESLELSMEEFTGKNSKQLCLMGMYRKMIIKPSNVSFQIISHSNIKEELQSPFYTNGVQLKVPQGNIKAVQVVMQLPKSSYATIALRQLLHVPSSFQSQMILNKLYEESNKTQKLEQTPRPLQKLQNISDIQD